MLRAVHHRRHPREPLVFGHVSMSGALQWLRHAAIEAGVEGYLRLHDLRSTFISYCLTDPRSTMKTTDVARMVGHRDLNEIQTYLQDDEAALAVKLRTLR